MTFADLRYSEIIKVRFQRTTCICMQYNFARELVYKIPYRRALAFRPSARASKGILHTTRERTRLTGQARATIGYIVYKTCMQDTYFCNCGRKQKYMTYKHAILYKVS